MIDQIKELAVIYFDEIVEIRRYLHQHPELSFYEHKTSAYIKSILTKWDVPFIDGIADTGIVVVLKGNNPAVNGNSPGTFSCNCHFNISPQASYFGRDILGISV